VNQCRAEHFASGVDPAQAAVLWAVQQAIPPDAER
jgi:hypothetical protein